MSEQIKLVVLTALMPEAVPMINQLRLKKQTRRQSYHLFKSEPVDLLVTGVGAARMAEAIRHYLQRCPLQRPTRWLNIGIAGAFEAGVGQLIWANYIGEQMIGCPAEQEYSDPMKVLSLAEPGTDYRPGVLFDMEAQACLDTLSENIIEFEPVHLFCAKVVSDNPSEPILNIDKHRVIALLQKHQKTLSDHLKNIMINNH